MSISQLLKNKDFEKTLLCHDIRTNLLLGIKFPFSYEIPLQLCDYSTIGYLSGYLYSIIPASGAPLASVTVVVTVNICGFK